MKNLFLLMVLLSTAVFAQYQNKSSNDEQISWLKKISAEDFKKRYLDVTDVSDWSYADKVTIYNLKKDRERLLGQINRLKNSDKQKTETGMMAPGGNSHYDSLFAIIIKMIDTGNKQLNGRMDSLEAGIADLKSVLIVKIEALDKEIEALVVKVSIVTTNSYTEALSRGKSIMYDYWRLQDDNDNSMDFASKMKIILADEIPAIKKYGFNHLWFSEYRLNSVDPEIKTVLEKIFVIIGESCGDWNAQKSWEYFMESDHDNSVAIRKRFKEIAF